MILLICPVFDWKYTSWTDLVQKVKTLFKMKVGTNTSSNMLNSMVMFIWLALDGKHPSSANLVQKIKTVCLI